MLPDQLTTTEGADLNEKLCSRLRKLRQARVLTIQDLSKLSGVHWTTISRIENDSEYTPHPRTIRKLAEALGTTAEWLKVGYGEPPLPLAEDA